MAKKRVSKKSPKKVKQVKDPIQEAMNIPIGEAPVTSVVSVNDLLGSPDALQTVIEMASEGASIGTIEAALGMQDRLLLNWCLTGKQDQQGPFFAVYQIIRKAAALARLDAERALLVKNPMKWLENNSASQLVEASPNAPEGLMTVDALPAPEGSENGSQKPSGSSNGLGYLELAPQLQENADEVVRRQIRTGPSSSQEDASESEDSE